MPHHYPICRPLSPRRQVIASPISRCQLTSSHATSPPRRHVSAPSPSSPTTEAQVVTLTDESRRSLPSVLPVTTASPISSAPPSELPHQSALPAPISPFRVASEGNATDLLRATAGTPTPAPPMTYK
ncbi:hypothetical protein OsI_07254 [Oryza sativa Indica Group]|uniref:Uncharacterized protein n=1 Tax=Oryza sativa subsp. indica TaxID=39946 RepID=B8AHZ0_ORYSI|nr:hypothetical protein OsI_07254 [Oryza sativa Indica Group]